MSDSILSVEDVRRFCCAPGRAGRGGLAVYDSHEALRARLAEVEAERERWYVTATQQMELAQAAEDRLAEVEAERDEARESAIRWGYNAARWRDRLAEVEQALRQYGRHDDGCSVTAVRQMRPSVRPSVVPECDCGLAAVLDKGKPAVCPHGSPWGECCTYRYKEQPDER